MSEILCVHCQQPLDPKASRQGNFVTCGSCKEKMYLPQVQRMPTAAERQAAAAAKASATVQTTSKKSRRSGSVASNGLSVAAIIIVVACVGGAAFLAGGFFVYQSIKGHMDNRRALAASGNRFDRPSEDLAPGAPKASTSASPSGNFSSRDLSSMPTAFGGNGQGSPSRSDLEKLQRSFQAFVEISARLEEDYKKELTDVGLNRLLVAERIAADRDFKQSRQIIGAAREVIDKHRKIAVEEDEAFLEDLSKLKLEGIATELMVMRIRGVMQASQPHIEKLRGMDVAIAGHYERAINHLEATQGTWKLEGESVVFNQGKDAERYKTFFDEVDKCVQTQLDLAQRIGTEAVPRWKAAFGL